MQGNVSAGMMERPKLKKKMEEAQKKNIILKKAVPLARKAWKEEHSDVSFPVRSVSMYSYKVLKTLYTQKEAGKYMNKVKEMIAEREDAKIAREERKRAGMNDEQKKQLEQQKEYTKKAVALVQKKCKEVVMKMEEKKKKSLNKGGKTTDKGLKISG